MITSKKLTDEFINGHIELISLLKERAGGNPETLEVIRQLENRIAELVIMREKTDV